jgi:Mycothiol maleylpyruvate isomerase N-terminal domain
MRVHEMIVAERQHMADLLASLSQEQLARQSLCDAWTVHEVGAHLVTYLRFGPGWRSWPPPSCARPRAGPATWVRRR